MKISVSVTSYSWPQGPGQIQQALVDVAGRAESAGADTLWVADHLLQMDPHASFDEPMLEAYTTLGFLAAVTNRIRLGTMVTWASIRPPALLVKAVTTLDVLSGGRAWLGVGAGYQGEEAAMMGLPFPATAERFERMEELLRLAQHMWNADPSPFHGPFHDLARPIASPAPLGRPRVLIGGTGEKRTLPLVARYADACNLFDIPDGGQTVRRKLQALRRECDTIGRDPRGIEVTLSSRLGPGETAAQFAARCRGLQQEGIEHVVLLADGPWTGDQLDTVSESLHLLSRQ